MKALAILALACAAAACSPFRAQRGASAPSPQDTASQQDNFDELTKDTEAFEGFLDLFAKDDKLYMVVPVSRLGQEFLMEHKIARGVGAANLYGGTMLNLFEANVVTLERAGERVYLLRQPHRFRAEDGTAAARAVDLSFSPSVIESAKIEATQGDSLLLINVYDWVLSDLSGISQRVRFAASETPGQPGNVTFDKDRSYLESIKAFPRNLNLRARLTFKPSQPVSLPAVPDGRYITLSIHYTLAELPPEPMAPRLGDDRMGYFLTVHKDFTRDDSTHFVRYVNRWRLEPGEPAGGGLHYPKQPIMYHLDPTIPEEYRPYFKEGVEAWNKAFEKAGFKDAIRAELLPDSADAEDIRYATLRWNTSDQSGYGAIGPSTVDPRTGEIMDADMLFEASMLVGFRSAWRNFVDPSEALELALGVRGGEDGAASYLEHAYFAEMLSAQGSFLRAVMAERGDIDPGDPVPMQYVGEALRWVVMHEVGHTLGLRHNFRSSIDTPLEQLHDQEWARTRGLVSSVMDYHAPNVARRGQPQGYYYTPTVGSSDEWVIAYGYTSDAGRAAAIAREAGSEGHAFGTDEDASGTGALDPTVNPNDLSSDPLGWGEQRTELIAGLWADLPKHVLTDNARYADLTSAFQTLMGQYSQALAPALKYVGGQYVYRTRVGDANDRGPFLPVPRAEQTRALALLTERAFSESAFVVPPEVLAQFGPNRWSHWGMTNTFNGRIDYPLHEQVLAVQTTLLNQLTNPLRLARIRDGELKFGAVDVVTIPELMQELTQAVWREVWSGPSRDIPALRRDLQRAYLDRTTEIVATRQDRMPADARAVTRMRLSDLDRRIAQRLTAAGSLDAYTVAHLQESRARIAKTLDAGLEVELR